MKHKLLALDSGHPGQMNALDEHFEVIRPAKPDPERIIQEHQHEIKALTTYLTPVSRNLMEYLPNLEIVACGAVGFDHIDLEAAKQRGIAVTNTPDVLTDDTADVALLLLLNVVRRAVEGDAFVRARMWEKGVFPLGHTMAGKTAGIVGLGRIGQAIAQRLQAFNVEIVYHGPSEKPEQPFQYYADLKAMAADVDFLILACRGGEATKGLIDHSVLKALGPHGFLINIARGSVVNQDDLLVALSNKSIAGAGLDVYDNEPRVPEALFTMDHVVLTPHIGSATIETRTKMGEIVVNNLLAHFEGRTLLTPVI
ncbi:MAG: 2-hydroxyacid dehydrogenase [Alphaproteobacteria bacterium]|nr:2-hydroxyacid dehydrogenase [Alphaproteobacteria bacterium]